MLETFSLTQNLYCELSVKCLENRFFPSSSKKLTFFPKITNYQLFVFVSFPTTLTNLLTLGWLVELFFFGSWSCHWTIRVQLFPFHFIYYKFKVDIPFIVILIDSNYPSIILTQLLIDLFILPLFLYLVIMMRITRKVCYYNVRVTHYALITMLNMPNCLFVTQVVVLKKEFLHWFRIYHFLIIKGIFVNPELCSKSEQIH